MTSGNQKVGSLVRARVADQPFIEIGALNKFIEKTGLSLHEQVSKKKLLIELNSLVRTAAQSQLKEQVFPRDIANLRKMLTGYVEISRRFQNSRYPPMLPDYQWYIDAVERLHLYERECAENTKSGPGAHDVLKFQLVPQAMGLFDAAFGEEPVSTPPAFDDELARAERVCEEANKRGDKPSEIRKKAKNLAKLKARGSTVRFVRMVMGKTYEAIEVRQEAAGLSRPEPNVFNPHMRDNKTLSSWIQEAKKRQSQVPELHYATEAIDQGFFLDQGAWWEASRSYQASIRLNEKQSGN